MLDSLRSPVLEISGNCLPADVPCAAQNRSGRLSSTHVTSAPLGAAIALHVGALLLVTSVMTPPPPAPPPPQELHVEVMPLPRITPADPLPVAEAVQPVVTPPSATVVPPPQPQTAAMPPPPDIVHATPVAPATTAAPEQMSPTPAEAVAMADSAPMPVVPPPPTEAAARVLPSAVVKRPTLPQRPLMHQRQPMVAPDAVLREAPMPPPVGAVASPVSPPARPAAAPPGASADAEARLEDRILAAVQEAVQYPSAAGMMGLKGRAHIQLDYFNGHIDSPTLLQSTGASMLDNAAMAAVRAANYPKPPADFEGRHLPVKIWVNLKPG